MITSIEDLKKVKPYVEVELPPFSDGTPLTAALKKPSIIDMMCQGRVANPLMLAVNEVMGETTSEKPQFNEKQAEAMVESKKFMEAVAENCLVQPKLKDINEYAGGLTDEQLLAIYNFATEDTTDLAKFCKVPTNP